MKSEEGQWKILVLGVLSPVTYRILLINDPIFAKFFSLKVLHPESVVGSFDLQHLKIKKSN